MADTWYYKLPHQLRGPISFGQLVDIIHADGSFDRAAFRNGEQGRWIAARSICHVLQEGLWLESEPAATSDLPLEAAHDDLHELARLCAELIDASNLAVAPEDPAPAESEQWYCRMFDTELGPMPFDDLLSLARHGGLSLDDDVRLGSQGDWLAARTIERLEPAIDVTEPEELPEVADDAYESESPVEDLPVAAEQADSGPIIALSDGSLDEPAIDAVDSAKILRVVDAGDATAVRFGITRLGSDERLQQFREELDDLVSQHTPEEMSLDLDGVKTLPGPILKSLADLSRDGKRVVFVNASEQIREDLEFAQLDRWIEITGAGHSVVGD